MEQVESETSRFTDDVFHQVRHVLSDAYGAISSEGRLELDAEVSENLRYEYSTYSWSERLAGCNQNVTFHFDHPGITQISGVVVACSATHVEVITQAETFLLSLARVTHVEHMPRKIELSSQSEIAMKLHIHWLHDMCDSHSEVTVWFGNSKRFTGKVISVGSEYVELLFDGHSIAVNYSSVICVSAQL